MKKVILSVAMCCAFLVSTTAMAQDKKTDCPKTKTECTQKKDCKDKKECPAAKKEAKKSCCTETKK
ncbi:MAG: hypothetical protein E6772_13460 [Dysgonomonas sp.]|nr:hypothetical protein [Dysgonomonas sp.]